MSEKFIVFSDVHLHTWGYGSSIVRGRNSRLLFQQLALVNMFNQASKDKDVTKVICCGDLFHTHGNINAEVLQALSEVMRFGYSYQELIILTGNHDMMDKRRSITALSILNPVASIITETMYSDITSSDEVAAYIPYHESQEEFKRELDKALENDVSFLFLHQGVSGVPINSTGFVMNDILTPDMIPDTILGAFAGHYHSHKQVSSNLWIPGSMSQLTWTDVGESRGWLEVTTDENNPIKVKHVPALNPKFIYKTDKDFLGDIRGCFVRIDCSAGTNVKAIKEEAFKYQPLSVEVRLPNEKPEMVEVPKNFSTLMDLFHEYVETNDFLPEFVKAGKDIINAAS